MNQLSLDYFTDYQSPPKPAGNTGATPKNSPLSRWDRASRTWLSSGTFMLLFILFHALQVRNDLRNFTSTADEQLCNACHILENKVGALQDSLDASAADINPVNLKFARDLKLKIRQAFHFGAQIFIGRVREAILSTIKAKYCAVLGILVVFKNLMGSINTLILNQINFLNEAVKCLETLLTELIEFMKNPDAFFTDLLLELYDSAPGMKEFLKIPAIRMAVVEICGRIKNIDFSQIHLQLRRYLIAIIAALAMVLIIYNSLVFVNEAELEIELLDKEKENAKAEEMSDDNGEHQLFFLFKPWIPFEAVRSLINWLLHFLSYQPLWIFFTMGILGAIHLRFTDELIREAKLIKSSQVDPKIDYLTHSFSEYLQTAVVEVDKQWTALLTRLLQPIKDLIAQLAAHLRPILDKVIGHGKDLVDKFHDAIDYIRKIDSINAMAEGAFAFLDCLIFKVMRKYLDIGSSIMKRLLSSKGLSCLNTGVMNLLKGAISSIFKHLKRTGALKKMFSLSFLVFLRSFKTRSAFLIVYLIACLLFILQGVLMSIINCIFE